MNERENKPCWAPAHKQVVQGASTKAKNISNKFFGKGNTLLTYILNSLSNYLEAPISVSFPVDVIFKKCPDKTM